MSWEFTTSRQRFGSTISMYFLKILIFNSPFEKFQALVLYEGSLISQGSGEPGMSSWT